MTSTRTGMCALQTPANLGFTCCLLLGLSGTALYAWKPVAPDDFVVLGIVCTTTEDPPSPDTIRCVPRRWVQPSSMTPHQIWNDTGAGGGRPGSIWLVNNMDHITIVAGHEPPKDTFYELASGRFFMSEEK